MVFLIFHKCLQYISFLTCKQPFHFKLQAFLTTCVNVDKVNVVSIGEKKVLLFLVSYK